MRKIIRWSTPRKTNPKYEKSSRAPGISKWECKSGKGEHNLVFIKRNRGFFGFKWDEYKCSACGKRFLRNV